MRRISLLLSATFLTYACSSSSPSGTSQAGSGGTDTGGAHTGGTDTGDTGDTGGAGAGSGATGGSQTTSICEPGETRECVGPGKCEGGQECNDAGTRWSSCDCGEAAGGTGGAISTGGSGGSENSGGSGGDQNTGGSGGDQNSGGTGGTINTGGTGASENTGGTGGSENSGGTGGSENSGGTGGSTVTCGSELGINDGYYDNGTMCGHAWTAWFDGATIDPACGAAGPCFTGSLLCATGTIPALDAEAMLYPGILIGWNVAQEEDSPTTSTYSASGTGITVNYKATGATGAVRVSVKSEGTDYCTTATSGVAIPWSSFVTQCWPTGTHTPLPAGAPINSLAVWIAEDDIPQSITEFCVDGVNNY